MALNYAVLILAVLLLSLVQIMIKYRFKIRHGSVPFSWGDLQSYFLDIIRDPYLWLAGTILIVAAFFWYSAISRIPLGVAFTFAALAYPLVMLGSYLFLEEAFSNLQIAGCGLIVVGLIMISSNM